MLVICVVLGWGANRELCITSLGDFISIAGIGREGGVDVAIALGRFVLLT